MPTEHWSEGYATGAGYVQAYFDDLNPQLAEFVLLLNGLDGPPPGPCCELGFGQGVSLAMHAAGNPARRWWGNDFIPAHAAHAQRLVDAAGVDATVSDQSFEEFFARDDLPRFAFVGLHGVWSWVSAANRARIAAFLRQHLLPGGVVYLSYNSLAGWAPMLPVRELMRLQMERGSPAGRADTAKVQQALSFLKDVLQQNPAVVANSPGLGKDLAELAGKSPQYLLHEFFNEDWHPMTFAQAAAELAPAKLTYVCPSDLHQRFTDVHFTTAQQALLARIEDQTLRESLADVLVARLFRREYWVRGARPLARSEVARRLREQRIVLAKGLRDVVTRVIGARGELAFKPELTGPLTAMLEAAPEPVAVGKLLECATPSGLNPNDVVEFAAALVGMRAAYLAAPPAQVQAARRATDRLNAHLMSPQGQQSGIRELASPLAAGGIALPPGQPRMLAAYVAAPQQSDAWPAMVWDAMQSEGQQMMMGQQAITDRSAALAALAPLAQVFQLQILPALRRLGVVS